MEILLHWKGCLTQPPTPTNTDTNTHTHQNDLIHYLEIILFVENRLQKAKVNTERPVKNHYSFKLEVGTQMLIRVSSIVFKYLKHFII